MTSTKIRQICKDKFKDTDMDDASKEKIKAHTKASLKKKDVDDEDRDT